MKLLDIQINRWLDWGEVDLEGKIWDIVYKETTELDWGYFDRFLSLQSDDWDLFTGGIRDEVNRDK
jgi:hypothetical protein